MLRLIGLNGAKATQTTYWTSERVEHVERVAESASWSLLTPVRESQTAQCFHYFQRFQSSSFIIGVQNSASLMFSVLLPPVTVRIRCIHALKKKTNKKKTTHLMVHLYQIVASPVSKDHFSLRTIIAFPWGLFMHILKNILKFATHFFLRSLEMVCLVRIAADARDVIRKQHCRINCDTASQASLTIPV